MSVPELRNIMIRELRTYIRTVFENEEEFIDTFFSDWNDAIEIHECYFAGDRVRIDIFNIDACTHITTTLSTLAVCEWVEDIQDAYIT